MKTPKRYPALAGTVDILHARFEDGTRLSRNYLLSFAGLNVALSSQYPPDSPVLSLLLLLQLVVYTSIVYGIVTKHSTDTLDFYRDSKNKWLHGIYKKFRKDHLGFLFLMRHYEFFIIQMIWALSMTLCFGNFDLAR